MEYYTPAQASVVAKLPLKTVHKLIDRRLIRPHRRRVGRRLQRLLSEEQLIYLRLEAEGVRLLPLASRRQIARAVEASPGIDAVALSEGQAVIVQAKIARRQVKQELARLKRAQAMAVSNPEIMQGTAVYRGTRIPVDLVSDMLAQGATVEEILDGYPALDRDKVELAPLYVSAFPHRGRPIRRPWAKHKPIRVIYQRRVASE
jgi:uncharacterized protein (DUF433 family)